MKIFLILLGVTAVVALAIGAPDLVAQTITPP